MKAIKSICRVLTLVFGLGALVLFFTNFATITSAGEAVSATGTQFGFGSKLTVGEATIQMARSADLLVCFVLTAFAAVMAGLSFKFKGSSIAAPIFALAGGIYMLVIALSNATRFIDTRPLTDITAVSYTSAVLLCAVALFLTAIIGFAFIFVDDYISVMELKSKKKSIPQRVAQFCRDYKSEIKKIVWPGPRAVVRNTIVVLIACALIGAFIWVLDFGLAKLLNLILGI